MRQRSTPQHNRLSGAGWRAWNEAGERTRAVGGAMRMARRRATGMARVKLNGWSTELDFEVTSENVKACAIIAGWHGAGSEADAWAYLRRVGIVARSKGPGDYARGLTGE